ncbi:sporulation protein YunB [Tumebacillus sp. DT12]|uniref:Sporulation protein YunB n=1 Tax=Tumebacillus lacus TaxID=2995335 RepID=A0ABT3X3C2_9BACL|nr:sporulation protein YunB [Tumebacillus lacus]MCX7570307.1 sporulation protein YunB [Tumebacillus lacus]
MRKRMRVGRRKVNWRFVLFALLVLLLFSTIQTVNYLEDNLRPAFIKVAELYSKEVASEAINDSIAKRITQETNYEKLINLKENSSGKVTAGFFNLQEASRIQYAVTQDIQDVLHGLQEKEIHLPAGMAADSTILSSIGPAIPIKIRPGGHVRSEVGWETHEKGVNQTVHILYLEIDVHTTVVVPFTTQPSELKTKVPIAYLVMMGDVPQVVLNSQGQQTIKGTGGTTDLLPPLQLPDLNPAEGDAK